MFLAQYSLDHVGLAVKDLDRSIQYYTDTFGFSVVHRETLADRGIELCFLKLPNTKLELLMGTNNHNPISLFVEKRGEGMHHLCYEVSDIAAELKRLKALGLTLIDESPRPGAFGSSIAFIHPKSTNGVLTELCQPNGADYH